MRCMLTATETALPPIYATNLVLLALGAQQVQT